LFEQFTSQAWNGSSCAALRERSIYFGYLEDRAYELFEIAKKVKN